MSPDPPSLRYLGLAPFSPSGATASADRSADGPDPLRAAFEPVIAAALPAMRCDVGHTVEALLHMGSGGANAMAEYLAAMLLEA